MRDVVERLLRSDEPSIRLKTRLNVLGEHPACPAIGRLRDEVRTSARVACLLSERDRSGRIPHPVYGKWYGAHWVLTELAHLGYPPGDESLIPLREQVLGCWLSPRHIGDVRVIDGRPRRCGSQEGNALLSLVLLGLADERAEQLARNLVKWQWPDGGWNCDKRPQAANSSFHETLIPMRALALYGREPGDADASHAARRAAEVFLKRRLFRRQSDGSIIAPRFLRLHYPYYWHYNTLYALRVMGEMDLIGDERCADAVHHLECRRLPDGGFPADYAYYSTRERSSQSGRRTSGFSMVGWGGTGKRRMNEWVTAEALAALAAAGRL